MGENEVVNKKKILFINKSFDTGGIQSSLVNMANELSDLYDIEVLAYNPHGPMRERLKSNITVLNPGVFLYALGIPIKNVLRTKNWRLISFRIIATVWTKIFNNYVPIQIAIYQQKKLVGYDLAISFHQEQRKKSVLGGFVRVLDQCVTAKIKVAWIHFDGSQLDLDGKFNIPFYRRMDKIIFVSKSLMLNFLDRFPDLDKKLDYCYNFINYEELKSKATEEPSVKLPPEGGVFCFSACRLTKEKALSRAIETLSPIFKQNKNLYWYIAGDGSEKKDLELLICKHGLSNQILLIGNQRNPYSFMKNATLVMNLSYHEAAPMIYFEAKALSVPLFVTRTASSEELLSDGYDAFICDNSELGIYNTFNKVINNPELILDIKKRINKLVFSNQSSIIKVLNLLGN